MEITEAQMSVICDYNRLDAEYRDKLEVKEGVNEIKQAIRQVLAKESTDQADMERLEKALPGMKNRFTKSMGYSEAEFSEQLKQGVVLKPILKEALTKILTDPLMQV